MTEHTNTPELRFSEFKEEWISKYVGEYFFFKNGLNKGKEFFGSGSPIVNFTDVFNNRGLYSKTINGKVSVTEKEINQFNVAKGDVFFTRTSEVIEEIGMPSVLLDHISDCVFSGFVLRAREFNPGIFAESFKKYMFTTYNFRKEMIKKSSMTTRALTSGTAISNMVFIFPENINEQRKIGDFFSKLDQQIELEEKKLELLEQQKKGYMQKIFSQELRFKDEYGNDYPEWKKKKLDDVANYRRGSFPQPYGNKEWYDEKNGEPFVQVVDVDKNMKLHDQTKQKISDLAKPKSVKGFKGDIVVTLQGSIGRVALLHYDAYIDRTLLLIDSFKIEMNKNYFKYVLYLLFLKEKERAPGGTIKTITKKVLSNFKIDIPNVGEQEKIGKFFEKYDKCIQKQSNKIELLKKRKKSFLQKMFV